MSGLQAYTLARADGCCSRNPRWTTGYTGQYLSRPRDLEGPAEAQPTNATYDKTYSVGWLTPGFDQQFMCIGRINCKDRGHAMQWLCLLSKQPLVIGRWSTRQEGDCAAGLILRSIVAKSQEIEKQESEATQDPVFILALSVLPYTVSRCKPKGTAANTCWRRLGHGLILSHA